MHCDLHMMTINVQNTGDFIMTCVLVLVLVLVPVLIENLEIDIPFLYSFIYVQNL